MAEHQWKESFEALNDALKRLEAVVTLPLDEGRVVMDATIQRFEFTFELFWKNLKRLLSLEGIETKTPRETLQVAYRLNWIEDEKIWLVLCKESFKRYFERQSPGVERSQRGPYRLDIDLFTIVQPRELSRSKYHLKLSLQSTSYARRQE